MVDPFRLQTVQSGLECPPLRAPVRNVHFEWPRHLAVPIELLGCPSYTFSVDIGDEYLHAVQQSVSISSRQPRRANEPDLPKLYKETGHRSTESIGTP